MTGLEIAIAILVGLLIAVGTPALLWFLLERDLREQKKRRNIQRPK